MSEHNDHINGCIICGADLVYREEAVQMQCAICHRKFESNVACAKRHFVCDRCHKEMNPEYMEMIRSSEEKDPMALMVAAMKIAGVHMHGPEHHVMLPAVMLTCYKNCGGDIDYFVAMKEAFRRANQVPGGACGYMGTCGASTGAGIYACLVLRSSPVNGDVWSKPALLTSACLGRLGECVGCRCCKRSSFICIEEAVKWTKEHTGIDIPISSAVCDFYENNRECVFAECPFFPANK